MMKANRRTTVAPTVRQARLQRHAQQCGQAQERASFARAFRSGIRIDNAEQSMPRSAAIQRSIGWRDKRTSISAAFIFANPSL
jgi:hypothetical protein